MPFVPVANTVLAELRMTIDLQQVENTLYFEFGGPPSVSDMNDLGDALISWWNSFYAPLSWTGLQLREVVVTDLTTATSAQVTRVPATPALGTVGDNAVSTNTSLVVSFRTANRGRSFRGRNYIVGITEGQKLGANQINPPVIEAWIEAYEAMIGVPTVVSAIWVVVSRFSGIDGNGDPIPRAAGVTTPIEAVTIVDPVVDSQRRRLPGRGN